VVSAISCIKAGCIPSLYGGGGGGGGRSSSLFSSGRGTRSESQRGRRLGGMTLCFKGTVIPHFVGYNHFPFNDYIIFKTNQ
jgi:hypothetical protein